MSTTEDRNNPELEVTKLDGQRKAYLVLSEEERSAGFARPLRTSYVHNGCGVQTDMALAIAETYARDPRFYTHTFCAGCRKHLPVGEFAWSRPREETPLGMQDMVGS